MRATQLIMLAALTLSAGCSEEAGHSAREIGECNEVSRKEGCLGIGSARGFKGWMRVLPLTGQEARGFAGSLLEVGSGDTVFAAVGEGAYRVEAFTGEGRPDVLARPHCFDSFELEGGQELRVVAQSQKVGGCAIRSP